MGDVITNYQNVELIEVTRRRKEEKLEGKLL